MTDMTEEVGPDTLQRAIRTVEEQLLSMKDDLEDLNRRVRHGEFDALKDSTKITTEIRQWLRIATEMEAKLAERRKTEEGIVNGYALDLDAARTQIGCRLSRLRRCCRSG